ncbi:MAG: HAD hydrolase-like protein, partial [Frankiaceae bacterium]|nr:HAD hydrolase-like protein [Frankiaceae bacterium]
DGTLTDSAPGVVGSMQHAAAALGLAALDPAAARRFVGPPLHDNIRTLLADNGLPATPELVARGVAAFREHYVPVGMFDNALYDGAAEMVARLGAGGATLAVATSKPEPFAARIVEHFGLAAAFAAVVGSTLDGARSSKADIVGDALARLGAGPTDRLLMIGDREHDVRGAAAHGIGCLGALWGYGAPGELAAAGALALLAAPAEAPGAAAWALSAR